MCRYYVNAGNVPKALQWIPSVSLIKQAFEGLCDNEFPGLQFEPKSADGTGDLLQGEQVRHLPLLAPCYMPCLLLPCLCWQISRSSSLVQKNQLAYMLSSNASVGFSLHHFVGMLEHASHLNSSQAFTQAPGLSQCTNR